MQVLENRAGIPITLALVYMEVAARAGFQMVGLNMPGARTPHFSVNMERHSSQLPLSVVFLAAQRSTRRDM